MLAEDLPDAMSLSAMAGWNQTLDDWQLILQQESGNNWAATDQHRLIGTVTAIKYGRAAEWIGMMLVHPEYRNRGIGRRLMETVMSSTSKYYYLDATALGKLLYVKLGFTVQNHLHRLLYEPLSKKHLVDDSIISIQPEHFNSILTFDRQMTKINRSKLLRSLFRSAICKGWIVEKDSQIKGFMLSRAGRMHTQLGPLVSETLEVAEALVTASWRYHNQSCIIDVFDQRPAWIDRLKSMGFTENRQFDRMVQGTAVALGLESQWATAGPELG